MSTPTDAAPLIHIYPPSKNGGTDDVHPSTTLFSRLLGTNELLLLELQATIEGMDPDTIMGGLSYDEQSKTAYLTVGYQRLTGKVVDLKSPFAVLRKREGGELSMEDAEGRAADWQRGDVEMDVVEIIRKKVVFNQRPEPISRLVEM
ncbi:hypothetical protein SAICODRAFT_23129 [Saitoella complicata NRRL Y-17804]|uniref:uncharacterized protein n=1 Tax=Saitoella complicata (strain BCRC 22490 / CBS 7301 / JCM 7358 / NBRC 10748 / NRRL Y-17804) TaxID=698492 RepID=UPI0008677C59|nr:uncharacterized protein SAICODRAFT_23129 [Saitoella complicata NRRL Y-17804]ODQ55759.1 hypothetical protein SAICODRAFT_23129 [Saitoella complicata NRRL Y-17804]